MPKTNPFTWTLRYVRESREEMAKVTWPSKEETLKYSALVIAISVAVAAFFASLDWLLGLGFDRLIILSS